MNSISKKYYQALESIGAEQNRKIYKRHGVSNKLFGKTIINWLSSRLNVLKK